MANQKHSKLIRDTKKLLLTLNCKVDYIGSDELKVSSSMATFILKVDNRSKNDLRSLLQSKGAAKSQIDTALQRLGILEPQYICFFKVPKHLVVNKVPANQPIQVIRKLVKFDYLDKNIIKNSPLKYQI